MATNQMQIASVEAVDPVLVYGYPATCSCQFFGGTQGRHIIWYAGAPAALFANAPPGSLFIDTTNGNTYVMQDALTWHQT